MKIDSSHTAARSTRSRWLAVLPVTWLVFSACAHGLAGEPPPVSAAQSDSPAISPWAEPPPDVSVEEDPAYTGDPPQRDR